MRSGSLVLLFAVVGCLPAQGLQALIAEAEALGARTGVALVEGGRARGVHRAEEAFAPASNQKLVTAAAMLRGLGSDYRFRTRFELRQGRLEVHAGGDPNWITGTEYGPDALFRAVVAALQRLAVDRLAGIDIDAGPFTGPQRPPTWPQDQLDTYYCAPTGGLVLEQGTFLLGLRAGADRAVVELLAPAMAMPIVGNVALADGKRAAVYGAQDQGTSIKVSGRFARKSPPVQIRAAVHDPAAWFAQALQQALAASGIAIDAAATGRTGPVCEHRTPLGPALRRMLLDSSNFDAEQCLRVLGAEQLHDGSLAGGVAAVRAQVQKALGELPEGLRVVDGSGLSKENTVTPLALVQVLAAALAGPGGGELFAALPVAGQSGTLEGRFDRSPLQGRVHAKTGWIRGASALSGVLVRGDGSRCLFSILMNYDPSKNGLNQQLKLLQERMVAALDGAAGTR